MGCRAWSVAVCLMLAVVGVGACAGTTVEGAWGTLSIGWEPAGSLSIDIILDDENETSQEEGGATWVLTGHAHRFEDDLYAWQIHLSQEFESFMIIPNDFLAARSFLFAEAGVHAESDATAGTLHIEIPETAFARPLVTAGDIVDIHAIWIQLEPLFSVTVPDQAAAFSDEPTEAAVADRALPSGEEAVGAGAAHQIAEEHPEGSEDQQAVPVSDVVTHDWFPSRTVYVQGEAIEHRFTLLDPASNEAARWATATINLLRLQDRGPSQIVLFESLTGDPYTGVFAYQIDTSSLAPGNYELIIWTSAGGESRRAGIRIDSST